MLRAMDDEPHLREVTCPACGELIAYDPDVGPLFVSNDVPGWGIVRLGGNILHACQTEPD